MIYITGDTHREYDIHKINPSEFVAGRSLTRNDYVIICGDFGCVWDDGNGDRFWLKWLESLPWNTVFIDGNHENFDALSKFPIVDWHGGKVHQIRSNVFHLIRGEIFTIEDKKFLSFGGGFSHDLKHREEHKSWWKDEMPTHDEVKKVMENLEKNQWKVDYVLSHDIYKSHSLCKEPDFGMEPYGEGFENIQVVLETIVNKLDYQCWFNGHYHVDQIEYKDGKPCITLFEHILYLNELDKEIKWLFNQE